MKLKKYRGKDLKEVMLKIKEEMGEDAVILSTKKVSGGFEVLAASDLAIDEEPREKIDLIEAVKDRPVEPAPVSSKHEVPQYGIDRILVEMEELKKFILSQSKRHSEIEELKREIAALKGLIEGKVVATSSLDEETLPIYNRLKEMELEEKVLGFVMKRISEEELLSPQAVCEEVLQGMLRTGAFSPKEGVPVIFSGPTGVGKTTTLAKVASIMKLYEGKEVGIVSIDTFRVGALDQLKIYADILDIDFFTANTPEEFSRIVNLLDDRVILVDTAGRSPKDSVRLEEMKEFVGKLKDYQLLLVIPYGCRFTEALNIIRSFSIKDPDGIVLTKLDEAQVYGLPFNLSWHVGVPILYVTTGQRVPEDIEEPKPSKMVSLLLGEAES